MSRWRHLFNVAKVNWKATQPGGSNTAPINGVTPEVAWIYESATYLGIVLPGLNIGDIQLPQTLVGCSSAEAFEVMISTTLAQLGRATPIAPAMTTASAAGASGPFAATAGDATLSVTGGINAQVGPISATFEAELTITGFSMPAVPTPTAPAWSTSQPVINQFAMLPNSTASGNLLSPVPLLIDEVPGQYTNEVSGLPDGVTCALAGIPLPGPFWMNSPMVYGFTVTALPSAAPGTYQATFTTTGPGGTYSYNFVVVILDPTAYTLALEISSLPDGASAAILGYAGYPINGTTPATLEGLPSGTNTTFALTYDPSTGALVASLAFLVTVDPSAAPGTYTFEAALTGYETAPAVSPQLTVTAIAQTPGQPCPPFQIPNTLAAKTVCDGDWNVIGFSLFLSFPSEFNDPSQPDGTSLAFAWALTASPAYTSGYAAPPASSYLNILNSGPNAPSPQQVLAAWEDAFGPLPPKGKMKLMIQWIDPLTGAPGPQTTATVSWETGTNKGVATPPQGWPFPATYNGTVAGTFNAPSTQSFTYAIGNFFNYNGTVSPSLVPASYIGTGTPPGSDALPTGLTVTYDPPTVTYVDGVPNASSVTVTIAVASGAQEFSGNVGSGSTDGTITSHSDLTVTLTGDVTPVPPLNYLTMDPGTMEVYTPLNSNFAVEFTLSNSGPNDLPVSMITTNTDPDFTIEFGQGGSAAATATPTAITFALDSGADTDALVGSLLTSAGYAPAGYNLIDAPVIGNTATSVTVLSNNNPAAMTTAGIAAIIGNNLTVPAGTLLAPGTASTIAFIEVGATFTMPNPAIQIVASCGNNSTYSIVQSTADEYGGTVLSPVTAGPLTTGPGTGTQVYTIVNEANSAYSYTFTASGVPAGVTVTFSPNPLSTPAGSINAPTTVTTTMTVTVAAGHWSLGLTCVVTATSAGPTRTSFVSIS